MLTNAYFLAKIGADTAENEQHFSGWCSGDGGRVSMGTSLKSRALPFRPAVTSVPGGVLAHDSTIQDMFTSGVHNIMYFSLQILVNSNF